MIPARGDSGNAGQTGDQGWNGSLDQCAVAKLAIAVASPGPNSSIFFQSDGMSISSGDSFNIGEATPSPCQIPRTCPSGECLIKTDGKHIGNGDFVDTRLRSRRRSGSIAKGKAIKRPIVNASKIAWAIH